MPSLTPLTAGEIATLFGAYDEAVGVGNGAQTSYSLDFFPVSNEIFRDELVGTGDGVATAYQLDFYPFAAGSLELRRGTMAGAVLIATTHYTVSITTGAITLTGAGVIFLGVQQLHAKYVAGYALRSSTGGFTTGTDLLLATHYALNAVTGAVTLTGSGVAALGTNNLQARYRLPVSTYTRLVFEESALEKSSVQLEAGQPALTAQDTVYRDIVTDLESRAIGYFETERRWLTGPYEASPVLEGEYIPSVRDLTAPFYATSGTLPPFPLPFAAPVRLFGGDDTQANSERASLTAELALVTDLRNTYTVLNRYTVPAQAVAANIITELNRQETALTNQQTAVQGFLLGPGGVVSDLITSGNITDVQNAEQAITTEIGLVQSFRALLQLVSGDRTDGQLDTRLAGIAARVSFIDGTRTPQLTGGGTGLLTGRATPQPLWPARYSWITRRVRLDGGTVAAIVGLDSAQQQALDKRAVDAAQRAEIDALLAAQ